MKDYENLSGRDGQRLKRWLNGASKAFEDVKMGVLVRKIKAMDRVCRSAVTGKSQLFTVQGATHIHQQMDLAYKFANGNRGELYHLFSRLGANANSAIKAGAAQATLAQNLNTEPAFSPRLGGAPTQA